MLFPSQPNSEARQETTIKTAPSSSLLDQVLQATSVTSTEPRSERLRAFHEAATTRDALLACFDELPDTDDADGWQRIQRQLHSWIGEIDERLSSQLNHVLHHPQFQKLEASWRGLEFLVRKVPEGASIKIRLLNVSWRDLVKDQERALEFDQSQLFRKVYSEEFDTPGGEPFGLLIGDYAITHRPYPDHTTDDLVALNGIAGVAAAAFAPLITGVDPRFLEVENFTELDPNMDLKSPFRQLEYQKWRSLRDSEDARFLGLVVPRIILREPYSVESSPGMPFQFHEDTTDTNRDFLWGNGAFGLAAVAIRAFADSAWFAEIRGVRNSDDSAGLLDGLPAIFYDKELSREPRSVTDIHLTDRQEQALNDLGFIGLCHRPGTSQAVFFSTPSVQQPKVFKDSSATANARLSSMLHYVLCVSRIAHYLKIMLRDRIGSFVRPEEIQDDLSKWLRKYIMSNDNGTPEMKARYPLREAEAEVIEVPGKPGAYRCVVHLRPHFQFDQLTASMKLSTQITTHTPE